MSDLGIMPASNIENQMAGAESVKDTSHTTMSGLNAFGADSQEQLIASQSQTADVDIQKSVSTTMQDGGGVLTNMVI